MTLTKKSSRTQNSMVLSILKTNPRRKMSTLDVTEEVNKKYKNKFTVRQISNCLSRFKTDNMIGYDEKGKTSPKLKSTRRWFYTRSK